MLQDDRIVVALMVVSAFFGCLSFLVVCGLRVHMVCASKQVLATNKTALLHLPPAALSPWELRPPTSANSHAIV
ncbi:hypothetical protein H257_01687 [Aphanomyces astaci]|uniref:Uncharacterized protein n=1 Tax=Aphanomyces astaci TaxID=112090 RepID=W4H3B4_APHAT|nr:hypothetical protein H257_01687 [Aphanomyces astaci]ETV86510.1 hypothetical protein H257_01687 [Aphanomyces astaci]|eukprot:XP_009823309.1 hypothetical protein H257_01687 [Aphanomyces astaci]